MLHKAVSSETLFVPEAGLPEPGRSCAVAGLPAGAGRHPGALLGRRGAGGAGPRPPAHAEARQQQPGAANCRGRFLSPPHQPGAHFNVLLNGTSDPSDPPAAVIC